MSKMLKNTKRKNTQKGITLIALVITIIVLLILAGISISMLTGENGILTQGKNAKEKTEVARVDEEQKLQNYEDKIKESTDPSIKDLKLLVNSGDNGVVELPIEITDKDNFTVDWGDGTVEKIDQTKESSESKENKEIGKLASTQQINLKIAEEVGEEVMQHTYGVQHTYIEKNKEYNVVIKGTLTTLNTWWNGDYSKVEKIEQWGETGLAHIDLSYTNLYEIARPSSNSFVNVTDFSYAFEGTAITSIPENLFANCPNVTDFSYTFSGTGITSIPENLFANCPNVSDFSGAFRGTAITSIPENLFKNCSEATFTGAFMECEQLTNYIPLWESNYYTNENENVSETQGGEGCYWACNQIEDKEQIPPYWINSVEEE